MWCWGDIPVGVWSKVHNPYDLHMVQPDLAATPIISCFIKIQNGLTFLILAYPDGHGKEAVKWMSVIEW